MPGAMAAVARPGRLARIGHHRGPHRVGLDVLQNDEQVVAVLDDRGSEAALPDEASSGDIILNCLGESREIKERTGIAAYGHPAGTPGAGGVECLWARENGQRLGGGERGRTD